MTQTGEQQQVSNETVTVSQSVVVYDNSKELTLKLLEIITNCERARLITVDTDRFKYFKKVLIEERKVTMDQLLTAEKWILNGDWTYKGAAASKLLLSDFYPSARQLESVVNDSVRVLSILELSLLLRQEFERGKREQLHLSSKDGNKYIGQDFKQELNLLFDNIQLANELKIAKSRINEFEEAEKQRTKNSYISLFGIEKVGESL